MKEPIHAGDPRRSLAIIKVLEDLSSTNHRLDIISNIPFDTPLIIIQRWLLTDFNPVYSTIIANVIEMDKESINCLIFANDTGSLFTTPVLPMSGLVQWRLLDRSFLCKTVNWKYKSDQYQQLFSKEIPDEEPQS